MSTTVSSSDRHGSSGSSSGSTRRRRHHRRWKPKARRILRIALGVLLALVLLSCVWVAVRALLARDQLLGAIPLGDSIRTSLTDGKTDDLKADLADLTRRASSAASLTSDPVWRVAELVPYVGPNLTAFRQAAAMIDQASRDALPPLADLATTVDPKALVPHGGTVDLTVFARVEPSLAKARTALDAAEKSAAAIDTSGTVAQVADGVDQLKQVVGQGSELVTNLDVAAKVLPGMLGQSGARRYLLLSLTNSELRGTGGIPGAVTSILASGGRVAIESSRSGSSLGEFPAPVIPLTASEKILYRDTLGTFMQNVTSTPDFARSGALAKAMWEKRTGQHVDGVISIDPVALGYLLVATGPIDIGAPAKLDSANAAPLLLSAVYQAIPDPAAQDMFFAGVTGAVFAKVTDGAGDPALLVSSLVHGIADNRLHVWSADTAEQKLIGASSAAGLMPRSMAGTSGFGVYFNDSTGAKMDYYLTASMSVGGSICRIDSRPNFEAKVRLTSTAPANAATALPAYVTGGGVYGIPPGNISTNVEIRAPKGSLPYLVTVNGKAFAFTATEDENTSVAGVTVEIAPGASADVVVEFLGSRGTPTAVDIVHTPMVGAAKVTANAPVDCIGVQPAKRPDGVSRAGGKYMLSPLVGTAMHWLYSPQDT